MKIITTTKELGSLKCGTKLASIDSRYPVYEGKLWRVESFGVVDIENPRGGICGFNHFIDPLPVTVIWEPEA